RNVSTFVTSMPVRPAEIVPALPMPPRKVDPVIEIAMPVAVIALALSRLMPPAMLPVDAMKPVIVPLLKVMPPGAIVPSLVMLPVKLVFVTATHGVVAATGLSKLALMLLAQAANAAGAPP